ncbi:NAD(P)H-binding protein [Lacticaseibacillus hulanensis]|uniref:NAD(P)H-binding protein n=1 Tax=Lacticaseibacillus hulanensis TaxID=2493111 RepID=UPI000FD7F908|nr:NAD(P)H-binding protein [Lacticaseibacillus hulanensis]
MANILIIGANGQIARLVRSRLLAETPVHLTLYLRRAKRLQQINPRRECVVEADVLDYQALYEAMAGVDVVYANLNGPFAVLAPTIARAMVAAGVARLVYVTHLAPEEADAMPAALKPRIHCTLIDPSRVQQPTGALPEAPQHFGNLAATRRYVADLVVQTIVNPGPNSYSSLGISKLDPDTTRPGN